jgi:MSHA biogenesis protein MshP
VRAYQAARAGIEWGAFQVLDPNNTLNAGSCSAPLPNMPNCPGAGGISDLSGLAGSLAPFTVTVTCTRTVTTEGNRNIWMYQLTANACNHQPPGTPCPAPGTPPPAGYVERELTATLSKCKDSTAAPPRCSCN